MATIQEIRSKYPQYADLSDQQLASALHQKFYADLPADEFSKRIGLSQPTTSRTDAYGKAIAEGATFGLANRLAAGARMAEERDLPLTMQSQNGLDLFREQLSRGQQSIDQSRKDYPDVFDAVEPIAGATMASLAAPMAVGGWVARLGASALAGGIGGGAGSALNEAGKPTSTPYSIAASALKGGASMAAAELGGAGIAGAASKLIAPGIRIPMITPMRDKIVEMASKIPGAARDVSAQVIDALPQGAARDTVTKGVSALGAAAQKAGKVASSPFVTDAALPMAAALGGPLVSVPVALLKELMSPGMITRYLGRKPLAPSTHELLRQATTLPLRDAASP